MEYSEENAESTEISENSSTPQPVQVDRSNPSLLLRDRWGIPGIFRWVNRISTSGHSSGNAVPKDTNASFQVLGSRKILTSVARLPGVFSGFRVIGGFSYPAAEKIIHDPFFGSEETLFSTDTQKPSSPLSVVLFSILILLALFMAVALVVRFRRPPRQSMLLPTPEEEQGKATGWDDSLIVK